MHPRASKQYYTDTRFLFYCHIKIKTPIEAGEEIIDRCFDILEQVNKTYNSYAEGSYFDCINKNAGYWVEVDSDTIRMLKEIQKISELTDGAYNISVMPLLKLWGFYDENKKALPDLKAIRSAVDDIKNNPIEIEEGHVRIGKNNEIVTGSFIKAFAVDKVVDFLTSEGISDAIINAGGSTIYALNNEEHPFWSVNIPHPIENNSFWMELPLQNACFSLSGNTRHFREIGGEKYGHILNAKTGYPSTHLQTGATTKSAFWGDVFTTALLASDKDADVFEKLQTTYVDKLSYYVIDRNYKKDKPQFINH